MLTVIEIAFPSCSRGPLVKTPRSRSATPLAADTSVLGNRIANSSPPIRPAVSILRRVPRTSWAKCFNIASPVMWPPVNKPEMPSTSRVLKALPSLTDPVLDAIVEGPIVADAGICAVGPAQAPISLPSCGEGFR
jgi:hypothetical protein